MWIEILKEKEGRYHLTELSKDHLIEPSPWFLGPYSSSLKERPTCDQMLKVLKTGKPANWSAKKDEKEWSLAMEGDKFAEAFTAGMDGRGAHLAPVLAKTIYLSIRVQQTTGHRRSVWHLFIGYSVATTQSGSIRP